MKPIKNSPAWKQREWNAANHWLNEIKLRMRRLSKTDCKNIDGDALHKAKLALAKANRELFRAETNKDGIS